MRKPFVLVAVGATVLALATPSLAGPKLARAVPLTVLDPAGDANFANNQGGLLPAAPPAPPGGSMRKGADILKVTLGRKDDGQVVKALTVSMTLAGPPEQSTHYRVAMSAPGCSTYFVEYQFPPTGTSAAFKEGGTLRENCTGSTVFNDLDASVNASTITWTLPVKSLPGGLKLGTPLTVKYGQTNLETAVVFPGFDQVLIGKSFRIGQ